MRFGPVQKGVSGRWDGRAVSTGWCGAGVGGDPQHLGQPKGIVRFGWRMDGSHLGQPLAIPTCNALPSRAALLRWCKSSASGTVLTERVLIGSWLVDWRVCHQPHR